MELEIGAFSREEWNGTVERCAGTSLVQTWEYGEAGTTGLWRTVRTFIVDSGRRVGAAQAMVRAAPLRSGLVWINRGPLLLEDAEDDLTAVCAAIRWHWAEGAGMTLRVVPPREPSEDVTAALREAGFHPDRSAPRWTSARVDLTRSVEALRAALDQKWRNVLNRAERSGMTVESSSDDSAVSRFAHEYGRFLRQRRFESGVTPERLRRLYALAPAARRPRVLTAWHEGTLQGSLYVARYGTTAEYLAGVIRPEGRRRGAGQLVLWTAVIEAQRMGCTAFDLGGMHPQYTPAGILHFKGGLGGRMYELAGEFVATDGRLVSRAIAWAASRARGRRP